MNTALLSRLGLLRRLMRKELNEILRDRRTILTLVLMPLLLYPLLAVAFRTVLLSSLTPPGPPIYLIGVSPGGEGRSIWFCLHEGQRVLREREMLGERQASRAAGEPLPPHRQPMPQLNRQEFDNLEKAVLESRIHVGIRARPSGSFNPRRPDVNLAVDWELLYREDSPVGFEAMRYVESVCAAENTRILRRRLAAAGIDQRETPLRALPQALANPQPAKSTLLPGLVPLILILMTITGAVYPAIDVTAGERERGTLEILAAAPVSRLDVLFAKYVAVLTIAMLTALVNLGTMTVTLFVSGVADALFGQAALSPRVFVQVLALLLFFAAFFSAVLLALTSFARSFKEAQAYLVPLMLLALMPGVLSLIPGLELEGPLAIAPLINVALLTRDLLEGGTNPLIAVVVVSSTLLYALAALTLAARVFAAEAVLYSQSGGWADLFRRPAHGGGRPSTSSALLGTAFLFPSAFVIHGLLARRGEVSLGEELTEMSAANVLLFGGYPLLALGWGRVRLVSGLRLAWPSAWAWLAALLLGLCLWPWAHEIALLMRQAGIAALRPGHLQRLSETIQRWRTLSPLILVLTMAVLPAVLEELFFRGYLLSALLSVLRPRTAILTTAALFALFQLILGSVLVVERLLPSFLLGLILGWVCWKTGSVAPGMLLHALHNGCLILLRYYRPRLTALGWPASEPNHVPAVWLLAALLGIVLGVVDLVRLRPPERGDPSAETRLRIPEPEA